MSRDSSPPTIFITGTTAVGKSAFAQALASRLDGEIVSVDSMQVYRGLDIGTAKPSREDQARVPHHLIDVVDLTVPFDAAQFATLAHEAVADIRRRGRVPILCGGTGLYFKVFMDGVGAGPAPSPELRAELESRAPAELLAELQRRDPEAFGRIDRNNPRRVVRALETVLLTGRPASEARSRWSRTPNMHEPFLGLVRASPELRMRIDARVDQMFAAGLIEEVVALRRRGLERNRAALQAIGYRQVMEHLEGVRSLADTIALVKQRTRQFAKRQLTWFRGQFDLEWVDVSGRADMPACVEEWLGSRRKLEL